MLYHNNSQLVEFFVIKKILLYYQKDFLLVKFYFNKKLTYISSK